MHLNDISALCSTCLFFPPSSLSLSNNPFSPGKGQGAFSCGGLAPPRNAKQMSTGRGRVSFLDSEIFQQLLKVCVASLECFHISNFIIITHTHTHTHTHIYIHTYTYIYTHTHIFPHTFYCYSIELCKFSFLAAIIK